MYSPRMTLSELCSIYFADHPEASDRWRQCMDHHLRKWERWTRSPAVSEITESDLWDFRGSPDGVGAGEIGGA